MDLVTPKAMARGAVTAARLRPGALGAMASARTLSAPIAVDTLEDEWTELAGDASEPNSFAEYWFFAASARSLANGSDLRVVEVQRLGRLIGVLPLANERKYGRMSVAFVQNWCHHHLFLGTPLIRAGEEQAFWRAVLELLDEAPWASNFLHLRGLREGGPVHRGLIAAASEIGRSCATVHRERRALLESDVGSAAYYEATVRPKKRKEIRRLESRLDELGEVRSRRLSDANDLAIWCDDFLALERAGWKGAAGTALGCAADTEGFFRHAVAGAWAAGKLDFLRLDLDGKAIAMLVNFVAPPGAFSFKTAYDESYARFSPGVRIQLENLTILDRGDIGWMDSCATENHAMIDSLWSSRRSIARVTVRLSGFRRRIVHAACRTLETASAAARRLTSERR